MGVEITNRPDLCARLEREAEKAEQLGSVGGAQGLLIMWVLNGLARAHSLDDEAGGRGRLRDTWDDFMADDGNEASDVTVFPIEASSKSAAAGGYKFKAHVGVYVERAAVACGYPSASDLVVAILEAYLADCEAVEASEDPNGIESLGADLVDRARRGESAR